MASITPGSGSQPSSLSSKESISRDELLCLEHELYLRQVSESGIPLWVIEQYGLPLSRGEESEEPPLRYHHHE